MILRIYRVGFGRMVSVLRQHHDWHHHGSWSDRVRWRQRARQCDGCPKGCTTPERIGKLSESVYRSRSDGAPTVDGYDQCVYDSDFGYIFYWNSTEWVHLGCFVIRWVIIIFSDIAGFKKPCFYLTMLIHLRDALIYLLRLILLLDWNSATNICWNTSL